MAEFNLDAQFPEVLARLQQFIDETMASAEQAEAIGDEVKAASLRARAAAAKASLIAPGSVQETISALNEYTGALERANVAKEASNKLDAQGAAALHEKTLAMQEAVAVQERLMATPDRAAAWERYYQRSYASTPTAVAQSRYLDEAGGAVGAGYEAMLALDQRLLAVDAERTAELRAQVEALAQQSTWAHHADVAMGASAGYDAGAAAAERGGIVPRAQRAALMTAGPDWTHEEQQLVRYNIALGEYETLQQRASLGTNAIVGDLTRLGIAHNEASTALRRHGALTTEFIQALARGETTISEFGYQLGATVGKVAGWTAATGAMFAALGAVVEVGRGAIDASSGVQQLTRTIDDFNHVQAGVDIQNLSAGQNVSIKEAADAVFQFSRTFHSLDDAVAAARAGLQAFKLDNVDLAQSVQMQTAVHQQFGLSARQIGGNGGVYDMLSAGQREYNARMSQMIPLLQASAGAVATASQGDPNALNTLIQLGVYAQRTTQRTGAVIGQAFSRSAATFLSPATTKGQADLANVAGMGIDISSGDWTTILLNALARTPQLTERQRQQLPLDIFGPTLGARMEALFNPRTVQTSFEGIRRNITPQATAGSMQQEMNRELGRASEQIKTFGHELERVGAALGTSGAFGALGTGLGVVTGSLSMVRRAIDVFAELPGPVKDITEGFVVLGATLLFLNRTRFGASIADLGVGPRGADGLRRVRLSALPFVGASEATQARFDLRAGTSAAQEMVSQDLQRANSSLLSNAARQLELNRQLAAVERQMLAEGADRTALTERAAQLDAEILALQREEVTLEAERNSMLDAQRALSDQRTMLNRSARKGGYTDEQVIGMAGGPNDAPTLAIGRVREQQTAALNSIEDRIRVNEMRTAEVLRQRVAVETEVIEGTGETAALEERGNTLTAELARLAKQRAALEAQRNVALEEQAAVSTEGNVVSEASIFARARAGAIGAGAAVTGLAGGLRGFIMGLDPLMVAMIGLPILFDELSGVINKTDEASKAANQAINEPVNSIQALQQKIRDLGHATTAQDAPKISGGPLGILQNAVKGWGSIIGGSLGASLQDWATGRDVAGAERTDQLRMQHKALSDLWTAAQANFVPEANAFAQQGAPGRAAISLVSGQMRASMLRSLQDQGFNKKEIDQFYQAFSEMLQKDYETAMAAAAQHAKGTSSQLDLFARMTDKDLKGAAQSYSDRADVYGLQGSDLSGAIGVMTVMAARYRDSKDPTQLQALKTAQQSVISAVQKNVNDWINQSKSAPSVGASEDDLSHATAGINTTRQQLGQWVARERAVWGKVPGVMKAINNAAGQVYAQLDQLAASILQSTLQDMQTQNALAVAQVPGITPEADLRRQQIGLSGPQGLEAQLATAQRSGDWRAIDDLKTKIADQRRSIAQAQYQLGQSNVDAAGALATSAIMGDSPQADIARAQQNVTNAQNALDYAKSHGADFATVTNLQARLNDSINTLYNTMRQRDQQVAQDAKALIDSQSQLAADQETAAGNPVAAALTMLNAATRDLSLIRPQDYKTSQEYQAAVAQAQDEVVKRRADVISARAQVAQRDKQSIDALAGLRESRTDDPAAQARIALGAARRDLALIRPDQYQTHEEYVTALRDARAAVNKAQLGYVDAVRQDRISLIEARAALAETQTDDPVRQAQIEVRAAEQELALVRPGDYRSRTQYLIALRNAETKLRQARKSLTDATRQESNDLRTYLQARGAEEASETNDPVAAANINLTTAEQILASLRPGQFKTNLEYLTAVANAETEVNKARQQVTDAILQTDMSTLDFELHTQQISNEQYVQGLQQLLGLKNLSLQQRQDIMSKIFDAEHAAAVNLDVGNINLPTTYEVDRAIKGAVQRPITAMRQALAAAGADPSAARIGAAAATSTVNNNNSIVFNVSKDVDLRAVAAILDNAVSGNVTGAAQAAGMI